MITIIVTMERIGAVAKGVFMIIAIMRDSIFRVISRAILIVVALTIGVRPRGRGHAGTIAGATRTALPANGALTALTIIAAGIAAIDGIQARANGAIGAAGTGHSLLEIADLTAIAGSMETMAITATVVIVVIVVIVGITILPIIIARFIGPKIGLMADAQL
jgi:hypothetical protein